ncbi:FAD binding domain-containing protein [Cryptosporangium arvum]|uniref:FAD binding domain-containing protein n=1 Tax=Cryptosporangium arvum TaxID=80871 RepID=UPI0004AF4F09|nr:FAD binding domain-containing protein [Cryptosporangium arvum]
MDLNTIDEVAGALDAGAWRPGDGWLAGGTYLFSEPQPHLRRLRDLTTLGWPALTETTDGLEIAATCTIAELDAYGPPLFGQCCDAFLASFKIQYVATVGGNICAALPAGPMTSLVAALDGSCTIEAWSGERRRVAAVDFVTGDGITVLSPGEFLRSVFLPRSALAARSAFRRGSLHTLGRSAALVIGRVDADGTFVLTITASTRRPVQLRSATVPSAAALRSRLSDLFRPDDLWLDDVHGLAAWRRHLTLRYAGEVRDELAATP